MGKILLLDRNIIKLFFKLFLMNILFILLELYSFKKKTLREVNTVGILFLPPLGIGDLVMLSPAIQYIKNIFPQATISIVTWVPSIINFEGIEVVNYKKLKSKNFDLIISPALNLKHLEYIFKSRYWFGYFTKSVSQSNFSKENCYYDLRNEHYLHRALRLVALFSRFTKSQFNLNLLKENNLIYPEIKQDKPAFFDSRLAGSEYFVLGALSKWPDRQWPVEKFAEVVSLILDKKLADKLVIIGDSSKENIDLAKTYMGLLDKFGHRVVNLTGVTTLPQTAYILARSKFYLGLDSGPSHLAYLLAPKSVSIFITVDPKLRLPFLSNSADRLSAVYLNPAPAESLYNGLGPVRVSEVKKYLPRITVGQVMETVQNLLLK